MGLLARGQVRFRADLIRRLQLRRRPVAEGSGRRGSHHQLRDHLADYAVTGQLGVLHFVSELAGRREEVVELTRDRTSLREEAELQVSVRCEPAR